MHIPVHRDAIDDAEKKTADAEQRLETFIKDSGLAADDSHLASLKKLIAGRREAIAKARERNQGGKKTDRTAKKTDKKSEQGGSFVSQVAPIIKTHCLDCHGKEAKGGLRLDTFAGWEKGGKSSPLLVIGDAENSLLMGRLVVPGPTRMPKGGEPLSEADCLKIAEWINRGAKFDGDDPSKPLDKRAGGRSRLRAPPGRRPRVADDSQDRHPKAERGRDGRLHRDIAPILVNSCLRCHSGNEPKGGLSMETFDLLWTGGKSGPVIDPGQLGKSRLWQLAGEQKPFKMPPGDERITRSEWAKLRAWIRRRCV